MLDPSTTTSEKQTDLDPDKNTSPVQLPPSETTASQPGSVAPLTRTDAFVSVVALPEGYGLLPITLGIGQVSSWTGLKKTKIQDLINTGAIATSKVDGRTLVLTNSVIALIERTRVERGH